MSTKASGRIMTLRASVEAFLAKWGEIQKHIECGFVIRDGDIKPEVEALRHALQIEPPSADLRKWVQHTPDCASLRHCQAIRRKGVPDDGHFNGESMCGQNPGGPFHDRESASFEHDFLAPDCTCGLDAALAEVASGEAPCVDCGATESADGVPPLSVV